MPKPKQIDLCDGSVIPILYEDRNVLALDKPSGWMLAPNTWVHTSRNLQLALDSSLMGGDFWARSRNLKFIRYIHRLDADASGILLMAKNPAVLAVLSKLFEERRVDKHYLAVIEGIPNQTEWECALPLAEKVPSHKPRPGKEGVKTFEASKVRAYVDPQNGKPALTQFRLLAQNGKRALIEAHPLTGRTHQIRVHLAESSFPIVGDTLYGKKGATLALRALQISYRDPFQKKQICITAPYKRFAAAYGFPEFQFPETKSSAE